MAQDLTGAARTRNERGRSHCFLYARLHCCLHCLITRQLIHKRQKVRRLVQLNFHRPRAFGCLTYVRAHPTGP